MIQGKKKKNSSHGGDKEKNTRGSEFGKRQIGEHVAIKQEGENRSTFKISPTVSRHSSFLSKKRQGWGREGKKPATFLKVSLWLSALPERESVVAGLGGSASSSSLLPFEKEALSVFAAMLVHAPR